MSGFVIGKLIFTHGELQWKKCEEIKGYLFILLFLWSKDVKKILFWKGGVAPMAKGYSHITYDTRVMIEKLYKKVRRDDLADVLGITSQSLYRELRRCPPKCYTAEEAEAHAKRRSEEGQDVYKRQAYGSGYKRTGLCGGCTDDHSISRGKYRQRTVSYTHLDVYKRQAKRGEICTTNYT